MADNLRQQRKSLKPDVRHVVDDVETKGRRKRDETLYRARGKNPSSDREGFFQFRASTRQWNGGPSDGADRYPEHAKES